MILKFSFCLLVSLLTTVPVLSQSKWKKSDRPRLENYHGMFGVEPLPYLLGINYNLTYTLAITPWLGQTYGIMFAQPSPETYKPRGFWDPIGDPPNSTYEFRMTEISSGMYINLTDEALSGLYAQVRFAYQVKWAYDWQEDDMGIRFYDEVYNSKGIVVTPSLGYRYFYKQFCLGAELGYQAHITNGDNDFGSAPQAFFFGAADNAPVLRINLGFGFY